MGLPLHIPGGPSPLQGQANPPPGFPTFRLSQGKPHGLFNKQLIVSFVGAACTTEDEADFPVGGHKVGWGHLQTPELKPNSGSPPQQAWKHHETPQSGWSHGFSSDLLKERPTHLLTQQAGSFYDIISRRAHKPFSLKLERVGVEGAVGGAS